MNELVYKKGEGWVYENNLWDLKFPDGKVRRVEYRAPKHMEYYIRIGRNARNDRDYPTLESRLEYVKSQNYFSRARQTRPEYYDIETCHYFALPDEVPDAE